MAVGTPHTIMTITGDSIIASDCYSWLWKIGTVIA
jgi:hypothetical protein